MKKILISILFILFYSSCDMTVEEITSSQSEKIGETTILFLNQKEGFEYIMKSSFVETMGLMDFSIRMI